MLLRDVDLIIGNFINVQRETTFLLFCGFFFACASLRYISIPRSCQTCLTTTGSRYFLFREASALSKLNDTDDTQSRIVHLYTLVNTCGINDNLYHIKLMKYFQLNLSLSI